MTATQFFYYSCFLKFSFKLLKIVAGEGDSDALYDLGLCYLNGIGTAKNCAKAAYQFMEYVHFVHTLPLLSQILNVPEDPNYNLLKSNIDTLLLSLNDELQKQGFVIRLSSNGAKIFSKFRLPFEIDVKKNSNYNVFKCVISNILHWMK